MKKMIEDIDTTDWYSRDDVARELTVSLGTVDRITMLKMFTMTRSPRNNRVYFLKSEVDHMKGYDDAPITSRRAVEYAEQFRMQQRLESPLARQEASSGASFAMTPEPAYHGMSREDRIMSWVSRTLNETVRILMEAS